MHGLGMIISKKIDSNSDEIESNSIAGYWKKGEYVGQDEPS